MVMEDGDWVGGVSVMIVLEFGFISLSSWADILSILARAMARSAVNFCSNSEDAKVCCPWVTAVA